MTMKNSIKKIAICLSAAVLIPTATMASQNPNIGYQSLNSAKQALNTHLSNPKTSTDPFVKSGSSAINYSKEKSFNDIREQASEVIDVYRDERRTLLQERGGWVDDEQTQLADKIREAKKHKDDGEHVDIDAIYEEYHNSYASGRLVEMNVAKEQRIDSIIKLGDSQSDLNVDSVNAHRTSVNNLLNAYNERRLSKGSSFLDSDYQNRINRLNDKNNRVQPVIERAALFGDDCPACQMPQMPVITPSDPIVQPPVYTPSPVTMPGDPCNGELIIPEWDRHNNPYIRYRCP